MNMMALNLSSSTADERQQPASTHVHALNESLPAISVQLPVPSGTELAGFGLNRRSWRGGDTEYPLEANLVALATPEYRVVICSIDAVYANQLDRQLKNKFAGTDVKVVIAASHTHYAPSLMPEYEVLGKFSDTFSRQCVDSIYQGMVQC